MVLLPIVGLSITVLIIVVVQYTCKTVLMTIVPILHLNGVHSSTTLQVSMVVHLTGMMVLMTVMYITLPLPIILQVPMVVRYSGLVIMVGYLTPTSQATLLKV